MCVVCVVTVDRDMGLAAAFWEVIMWCVLFVDVPVDRDMVLSMVGVSFTTDSTWSKQCCTNLLEWFKSALRKQCDSALEHGLYVGVVYVLLVRVTVDRDMGWAVAFWGRNMGCVCGACPCGQGVVIYLKQLLAQLCNHLSLQGACAFHKHVGCSVRGL